jgi:Eukaryotic aspartyl protease
MYRPLLLDALKDQGKIAQKTFAFYFSLDGGQSTIEFGGYSTANLKNPLTPPVFIPCLTNSYSSYWSVNVTGFRVGPSDTFSDGTPAAYSMGTGLQ